MAIINQPQVAIMSDRRDRAQAGGRHAALNGDEAIVIHPGRQPRDELGSPRLRRRLRRTASSLKVKQILETQVTGTTEL
jgi:hypothetical protein